MGSFFRVAPVVVCTEYPYIPFHANLVHLMYHTLISKDLISSRTSPWNSIWSADSRQRFAKTARPLLCPAREVVDHPSSEPPRELETPPRNWKISHALTVLSGSILPNIYYVAEERGIGLRKRISSCPWQDSPMDPS